MTIRHLKVNTVPCNQCCVLLSAPDPGWSPYTLCAGVPGSPADVLLLQPVTNQLECHSGASGINAPSQARPCMPTFCHSRHQHHELPVQPLNSAQALVTCEESWPWDDLLDSPGADSFQSASTTYDPPSVDSIPDSFVGSTGTMRPLTMYGRPPMPLPSSTEASHQVKQL